KLTIDLSARPDLTATIVFKDEAINTGTAGSPGVDPLQIGNGLVAFGVVHLSGAEKTTFVRFSQAPRAGQSTLRFENAVTGWRVGDRVAIPGSGQSWPDNNNQRFTDRGECEEALLTSVGGTSAGLDRGLRWDHLGVTAPKPEYNS